MSPLLLVFPVQKPMLEGKLAQVSQNQLSDERGEVQRGIRKPAIKRTTMPANQNAK